MEENDDHDMELELKFSAKEDYSKFLLDSGFEEQKQKHQVDTYFISDELIENRRTWLRLREDKLNNNCSFDLHRLVCLDVVDETEVKIDTSDSEKIKKIINLLGLKVKCVVEKRRRSFRKDDVEVTLDNIKNLGDFVEIEIIGKHTKNNIDKLYAIAETMNLHKEDKICNGYPELLLEKGK